MSQYTRKQIRQNREIWIKFLMQPKRKKATGALDKEDGNRCCLGHGCYALKIGPRTLSRYLALYKYQGEYRIPPQEFVEKVGLTDQYGSAYNTEFLANAPAKLVESLVALNDRTSCTPQQIGQYLLSVIKGGIGTPFKPLTSYQEK